MDYQTQIIKKLEKLQNIGCEIEMVLIQKENSPEQLGINDYGEQTETKKMAIKAIPIIRGFEEHKLGEVQNGTAIGNNPDEYLEFIIRADKDNEVYPATGERVLYQEAEYSIYQCIPVVFGGKLLIKQYAAKKVK